MLKFLILLVLCDLLCILYNYFYSHDLSKISGKPYKTLKVLSVSLSKFIHVFCNIYNY